MKLEQELFKNLVNDIVEDEKKLKELKQQILAKKITAKAIKKKAEQDPLDKPSKLLNRLKLKFTSVFAHMHDDAFEALSKPEDYAANKLHQEADKLLSKAEKLKDNTHKKAEKVAIQCAEMVMRLEDATEVEGLSDNGKDRLTNISMALDGQVQRLRPNKKENEPCSAQQLPSQSSPSQDACSSTESSLEESESSLRSTPCSQTC